LLSGPKIFTYRLLLGIEWDKNNRGRHDGSCVDLNGKLIRYFQCDMGCGSFVKPTKIFKGRNFTDALLERYVSIDAPEVAPNSTIPDTYVLTSKGRMKAIELVGERKIRFSSV